MLRAGLWSTSRHLVVALQLPAPRPSRLHVRVPRTLEGREHLAAYLAREPYLEVVVPEPLHRFDPVADHLLLHRVRVFIAPCAVLDQLFALLRPGPRAYVTVAAAIARLPTCPRLRLELRELEPQPRCARLPRDP